MALTDFLYLSTRWPDGAEMSKISVQILRPLVSTRGLADIRLFRRFSSYFGGRLVSKKIDNVNISEVAALLRAIRIAKKWSQQDVADLLGTSLQQYQKSEYGTAKISAACVLLLSKEWSVPPSAFFPFVGIQHGFPSSPPSKEDYAILLSLSLMDEKTKNSITSLIRSVAKPIGS